MHIIIIIIVVVVVFISIEDSTTLVPELLANHTAFEERSSVKFLKRIGSVARRRIGIVTLSLIVPHEHRLNCVVLADVTKLDDVLSDNLRRYGVHCTQHSIDAVEERDGHREEEGLLVQEPEEDVTLFLRTQRLSRPSNRKHLVPIGLI